MPRPTLKLPKPGLSGKPAEPSRPGTRKPLRGGGPATRRTSARNATTETTPSTTRPDERSETRTTGPANAQANAGREQQRREAVSATKKRGAVAKPTAQEIRPAPESAPRPLRGNSEGVGESRNRAAPAGTKLHPPRGIARSTGARACRPAPVRSTDQPADQPAPAPAGGTGRTTAPATAPERPSRSSSTAKVAASFLPRGPAKESPRLSKLVSQLAHCSRREADEWIENGWVSVDGVIADRLGVRVNPKARIVIQEIAYRHPRASISIVFNKPPGAVDTTGEAGREAVAALIRADNRWLEDAAAQPGFQASHLRGLALAGKLEAEESGMLAFTQEGSVARRLTGAASQLEKEYHVRIDGEPSTNDLALLRHGLTLDGIRLPPIQVSRLSEKLLRFVLFDDRRGQILRLCALVGLRVTGVKRVRIGSVSLGRLPPGQWRYLRADERF